MRVAADGAVKSIARLTEDAARGHDPSFACAGPYARQTCNLVIDGEAVEYLGAVMGDGLEGSASADFVAAWAKAA
eukprot:8839214-Alexandrium_andersonii.AAC.1